jgi:threonine dehydratase
MDYKELLDAHHDRIKPFIHNTPVMSSTLLDNLAGAKVLFKCENFQRMGAFKMRGATNAILGLSEDEKSKGVVTHSSGNMAQAVSLAARSQGIEAHIVMPRNAPQVKKDAVRDYGGIIHISDNNILDREKLANELVAKKGCSFIHPSNDLNVIIGQGTASKELLEQHSDLDCLLTPVGGGGLLAGTALAANSYAPHCNVYAGEPMEVDDAYRSFHSGKIELNETTNTVADGLRTNLGDINFPIIKEYVTDILRVEEEEIVHAMRLIWERMKIIIEPSCAVPFAAVLKNKELFKAQKVGIILSGGNVDLSKLPF